jgi:ATP-binding cassette, subfamily F, member 3
MLSLTNITLQFGERVLLDSVSFMIGPHDRIGLVGSNGAGKSTLLKIIAGISEAEKGNVNKAQYVTVGYLPQDGVTTAGRSLYKEVESAFENILSVQKELDDAHAKLAELDPSDQEYADTLEVYGELQHKLEDLDAFTMKSKIERVLMGLGFSTRDFDRTTEEFSGGWQMRIELAKLLLREPSALLLDEPTNHLDLESLQWLEEYLRQYNGAIILVSHDRAFLDNLTNRTLALGSGSLEEYAGNYSFYEREKIVRKELLMNAYKNQQQQLKQTQQFIDRFRYKATKARQVQSRIKQLEKLDRIEVEDEEDEIHFHFPPSPQSGRIVMELKDIHKEYDGKVVFDHLNFTVERGDKIAIVGVNGAGKSTFVRILAGVESFDAGERIEGYNTMLSYFAQHQAEELDMSKEVIQIVDEVATGEIRTKVRTILGSFLFRNDDVFKKVRVLSGGEKSRLALAKMLLQPSNYIIMDEPTNHLDMRSKKILQEALSEFDGTYVIVSHDRSFLDSIVNKVVEFSHGKLRTFLGNVSDYLRKKAEESKQGATVKKSGFDKSVRERDVEISHKGRKKIEAEERQKHSKKLHPLKKDLDAIEKSIQEMEDRKQTVEMMMSDPDHYKNGEEARKTAKEYQELETQLKSAYYKWGLLNDEIEKMKG